MTWKVPDFHIHVLMFSYSKVDAIDNGETHFQISGIIPELAAFFFLNGHFRENMV